MPDVNPLGQRNSVIQAGMKRPMATEQEPPMTKLIAPTVDTTAQRRSNIPWNTRRAPALKITPEPIEQGLILRLAGT